MKEVIGIKVTDWKEMGTARRSFVEKEQCRWGRKGKKRKTRTPDVDCIENNSLRELEIGKK